MYLAPLTTALNAMLADLPFAIAQELDAGAVNQQVWRTVGAPAGDLDRPRFLPPTQGRIVRHSQSTFANFSKLATIPVVCRNGSVNRTLIVRQNWTAASENTAGRPGRPPCRASQVMSLSSQITGDPRLRSAAVQLDGSAAQIG
jgi:hypothetical protein